MKNWMSALVFLMMASGVSKAAVWNDVNTWNDEWEKKFASWVEKDFNEDIFMVGKYKGLANDCADAVYMGRMIFAYENKLPYVIVDSTSGGGKITNRMTRFDGVKDDLQRAREMLKFVAWNVSSKTFTHDTYPVKITRQYVHAGSIWVRPSRDPSFWGTIRIALTGKSEKIDPSHAETIKKVTDSGSVLLLGSTTPAAVRHLTLTSSFFIMPESLDTGIRIWMHPEMYGKSKGSLPGYSEEQFSMGGGKGSRSYQSWRSEVQARLQTRAESKEEAIDRLGSDLCSLVQSRAEIVKEAIRFKARHPNCMSASEYDGFSTPTRDKRIKATLKDLTDQTKHFGEIGLSSKVNNPLAVKALSHCDPIDMGSKKITLLQYMQNVAGDSYSSNPNDSVEARWGFASGERSCPSY